MDEVYIYIYMERKNDRLPIFTERFRELQGEKSNTEFAEFLGLSRQTVGFYCNGDRVPDALTLIKISQKCGVSADWLLGLSDVRSLDGDLKQTCKYTGLSEVAATFLHTERSERANVVINMLLYDPEFRAAIYLIASLKDLVDDYYKNPDKYSDLLYEEYEIYHKCEEKLREINCSVIHDRYRYDLGTYNVKRSIENAVNRIIPPCSLEGGPPEDDGSPSRPG